MQLTLANHRRLCKNGRIGNGRYHFVGCIRIVRDRVAVPAKNRQRAATGTDGIPSRNREQHIRAGGLLRSG